jgi:F-type H+-transporting ATPase subunit b
VSELTDLNSPHFWVMIALLVFGFVMWRVGAHGMVGKALDAAGAKVQAQLDEASRLRGEAESLLAQVKTQRADTERAAADMLKAAQADADRMRAEAAVKLDEDIKRRGELASRKIAIAEAQAAGEVKAAAADLAAQTAEAVLTARIAGAKGDPLIDAGLAGLGTRFAA